MRFDTAPPFAPYCDYSVNFRDCEGEQTHFIIFIVGAVLHVMFIIIGCYTAFYARLSLGVMGTQDSSRESRCNGDGGGNSDASMGDDRSRMIRQPMKLSNIMWVVFLIVRLVHITLCMLEIVPLLSVRMTFMSLSLAFGYYAIFIFAAGVIETVHLTVGRTLYQQKSYFYQPIRLRVFSSRIVIWFLATLVAATTLGHLAFMYVAGKRGQEGDWDSYTHHVQYGWAVWSVSYVIVGVLYAYYAIILTMTLQQLIPQKLDYKTKAAHYEQSSHSHQPSSLSKLTAITNKVRAFFRGNKTNKMSSTHSKKHGGGFTNDDSDWYPDAMYMHNNISNQISLKEPNTVEVTVAQIELNERIKSIKRLRSILYYLLFVYIAGIISVFLWGFGIKALLTMPIFNRIMEILYVAIERARRHKEQLSSMGRQKKLWVLSQRPKSDMLTNNESFFYNDYDDYDDDNKNFNRRLSDPNDIHSPVSPSLPLSF
ncbi:hypothetical protein BDF19DRAFT_430055 [Syncephalis fuscata]|nr:hypothetical protein BDF19DRAFT_430055 [Syncephalis fuscata]